MLLGNGCHTSQHEVCVRRVGKWVTETRVGGITNHHTDEEMLNSRESGMGGVGEVAGRMKGVTRVSHLWPSK